MESHAIEPPRTPAEDSHRGRKQLACSIIIPVGPERPKFEECFASVLAAAAETDEIIVVADGEATLP